MRLGFIYQEELSKCSTMEDITGPNGLVQRMVKDAFEQILQSEIADYITDEKSKGNTPKRNGTSSKKVKTSYGSINIHVPKVRDGDFEPEVIKKRAVIEEGLVEAREWYSRAIDVFYPVVFLDAVLYEVREER